MSLIVHKIIHAFECQTKMKVIRDLKGARQITYCLFYFLLIEHWLFDWFFIRDLDYMLCCDWESRLLPSLLPFFVFRIETPAKLIHFDTLFVSSSGVNYSYFIIIRIIVHPRKVHKIFITIDQWHQSHIYIHTTSQQKRQ